MVPRSKAAPLLRLLRLGALAALGAVPLTVACSRSASSSDAGATAGACDEAAIRGSVDRLGKRSFPDNPGASWSVLSYKKEGAIAYLEVKPTPDEVGYPKFVFAIGCKASPEPQIYGAYAFDKGRYTLLFTTDAAQPLPQSPP